MLLSLDGLLAVERSDCVLSLVGVEAVLTSLWLLELVELSLESVEAVLTSLWLLGDDLLVGELSVVGVLALVSSLWVLELDSVLSVVGELSLVGLLAVETSLTELRLLSEVGLLLVGELLVGLVLELWPLTVRQACRWSK